MVAAVAAGSPWRSTRRTEALEPFDQDRLVGPIDGCGVFVGAGLVPFDQGDGALHFGERMQAGQTLFDNVIAGRRIRMSRLQSAAKAFDRIAVGSLRRRRRRHA